MQFAFAYFFVKFAYYGFYYWIPTYLQEYLNYSQTQAANITSWSSTGGVIGSILLGFSSDMIKVRSPVYLTGLILGATCLSLVMTIHTNSHTTLLTLLCAFFVVFENGSVVVNAIIYCDLGKQQLLLHRMRALSTIAGINDGTAGFGSILGQLLVGPVDNWKGWNAVIGLFSAAAIIACFPAMPYTIRETASWLCKSRNRAVSN